MNKYVTPRDIRVEDDEMSVKQDQCCLHATHLCLGALTLLLLTVSLLVASVWIEELTSLRRPLYAILFLAVVIVMATGTIALTVEWRIQDKLCVHVHDSGATCRNRRGRGSGHQTVRDERALFSFRAECERI